MLYFIEFDEGFAVVKMFPPRAVRGKDLATTVIRTRFGLTVLGIKPPGQAFLPATPESVIGEDDVIIVSGAERDLERFAALE
jgi:trk system potassium uptake protein TrkA